MRPYHYLILLLVILLLFGAQKLPDLARSLGKSFKILKSEINDATSTGSDSSSNTSQPQTSDTEGTPRA